MLEHMKQQNNLKNFYDKISVEYTNYLKAQKQRNTVHTTSQNSIDSQDF